jgi:hypothetical protein
VTFGSSASVRGISCRCGATLIAGDDDLLIGLARRHLQQAHPPLDLTEGQLRLLVVAGARDGA